MVSVSRAKESVHILKCFTNYYTLLCVQTQALVLQVALATSQLNLPRISCICHVDTVDTHLVSDILQGLHLLGIWFLIAHLQGHNCMQQKCEFNTAIHHPRNWHNLPWLVCVGLEGKKVDRRASVSAAGLENEDSNKISGLWEARRRKFKMPGAWQEVRGALYFESSFEATCT